MARDASNAEKNIGYEQKVYPRQNGMYDHNFAQDTDFVIEPRFKDNHYYADDAEVSKKSDSSDDDEDSSSSSESDQSDKPTKPAE